RVGLLERALMQARRRPSVAFLVALLFLCVVGLFVGAVVVERRSRAARADGLVDTLLTAEIDRLPGITVELQHILPWAEPRLRDLLGRGPEDSPERFRSALPLLPADSAQVEYLLQRCLSGPPAELKVIRTALQGQGSSLAPVLWLILEDPQEDEGRRL